MRSCALGVALLSTLLAAGSARGAGQNEDEREVAASSNEDAKKRFAEGNERYARGEYDAAVESFRAAIAAEPKLPGPYRNLGLAYRALNRCAEALPAYEKYLALKPESRFTERVRKEIELCRTKLGLNKPQPTQPVAAGTPTPPPPQSAGGQQAHPETAQGILHVAANLIGGEATDEATVKVDGLVRGATPMTIPVTAGVHKIDMARMGFESASATVEVGPGERRDVELTINKLAQAAIVPIVSPTGSSQSTVPATEEPSGPRKSYAKYGWILIGVAGATGAIGAGFGIAESKLHRDAVAADPSMTSRGYVDDKRHTGQIYGDVAEAGLAIGGAALLAGSIIFLADPSRGETHEPQKYVIAPAINRNGGSLVATVRF